jgi:hypothetical protein
MRFTERSETDVQVCFDIGCGTSGANLSCVPGSPHVNPCSNICKHGHIYAGQHGEQHTNPTDQFGYTDWHGYPDTHQHPDSDANTHTSAPDAYAHASTTNTHTSAADTYAYASAANTHRHTDRGRHVVRRVVHVGRPGWRSSFSQSPYRL